MSYAWHALSRRPRSCYVNAPSTRPSITSCLTSASDNVRQSYNAPTLTAALTDVTLDGTLVEFGCLQGTSLDADRQVLPLTALCMASTASSGFPGLGRYREGAGAFDIGAKPPELSVSSVKFHVGWFDDTIPAFSQQYSGPLPSPISTPTSTAPTKTVFDGLSDWFVPGTIVVFDEYFGYHGWQRHEHKAFHEFLARTGLSFEAISLGHMNLAVRLIDG